MDGADVSLQSFGEVYHEQMGPAADSQSSRFSKSSQKSLVNGSCPLQQPYSEEVGVKVVDSAVGEPVGNGVGSNDTQKYVGNLNVNE